MGANDACTACVCPTGFKDSNGKCEDIDECKTIAKPCSAVSYFNTTSQTHDVVRCSNTQGSYQCLNNKQEAKCPNAWKFWDGGLVGDPKVKCFDSKHVIAAVTAFLMLLALP